MVGETSLTTCLSDPIRLARMVNEIHCGTICFTIRARRMGSESTQRDRLVSLAHHRALHPDELDGGEQIHKVFRTAGGVTGPSFVIPFSDEYNPVDFTLSENQP